MLCVGGAGRGAAVEQRYEQVPHPRPERANCSTADQARELQPLLRAGAVELAMLEPDATEIDVHALHQHYVRGLRERDGVDPDPVADQVGTTARTAAGMLDCATRPGRLRSSSTRPGRGPTWSRRSSAPHPSGCEPCGARRSSPTHRPESARPMIDEVDETLLHQARGRTGAVFTRRRDARRIRPTRARTSSRSRVPSRRSTSSPRSTSATCASAGRGCAVSSPTARRSSATTSKRPDCSGIAGQGGYGIQLAAALARSGLRSFVGAMVPDDLTALGFTAA